LSSVLIFAFVMAGANKITDAIHAETHQELAKGFVQYGPVSALKFSHPCMLAAIQKELVLRPIFLILTDEMLGGRSGARS
jgi:hypothetical protein